LAAIDQVIDDSQQQHQRYLDLYGVNPANGQGFRDLVDSANQLVEQITDTREDVQALRFSTEVEGRYGQATASDHQPVAATAHVAQIAAHTTDTSAQINREGLAAILANASAELNQISVVPDRDSPEGQAAILNIIAEHQAQSAQTVTSSAAAQQAAAAQAAASGGPPGGGAAAGGAAAAAMGAMLPAAEAALGAVPQLAMTMIPAAGMATAPLGALSAVHAPPDGDHHPAHPAPPQQDSPSSPSTQSANGGSPHPHQGAAGPGAQTSPLPSQAPLGPVAPTPPPPPAPPSQDHPDDQQHVQLAGFGTGQHPPEAPPPPDPPHGHDPRYWLDTKQILTLPPGQLPPAGYKQIGPGMFYPSTDPGLFATMPPPPAQLPVDMKDLLHLPPGQLPPAGYREMAPGTYFPVPHGSDIPGPWPTPTQPIDVRDVLHLPPGQLPPPGYSEYAPGWYAPNINAPFISGGPR